MLNVIGEVPTESDAEAAQFTRILNIFEEAQEQIGPWSYLVLDHGFTHRRGQLIDVDSDWNGQIDILLLAPQKIAIYELKGFTASIISGTTGPESWKIRRLALGVEESVASYFIQASKQRAFILRDFFPRFGERHPEYAHNHWVVDSRLVFKAGADLSGFAHSIPMTETTEKLESDVLPFIASDDDKEFVRYAFSGTEFQTNKLHRGGLTGPEQKRLQRIYSENLITPRTAKWFKVITEEQVRNDLSGLGSDRFSLEPQSAEIMIEDLLAEAWQYTDDQPLRRHLPHPVGEGP